MLAERVSVRIPDGDRSSKRTGHRQSPAISHLALCLLLRRPRAIRAPFSSPSSSASSDGGFPFGFVPTILRGGRIRISNSAKTDRALRPRAAIAFASCPRNHEEGGTLLFQRAVRRPSTFLAASLFRSVAFLLSKEGAARMMPPTVESKRSPASSSLPPLRERNAKAKQNESTVRNGDGRNKPGTQQQTSSGASEERGSSPLTAIDSTQIAVRSPSDFSRSGGTGWNTKN